jgi:transposase
MNKMTKGIKKKAHSAEFKFKVAIEAIRGEKTMVELCREYSVVSSQIFKWKKDLLEKGKEVFSRGGLGDGVQENQIEKLHATIGRLTVENHFLAKCAGRGL